MSEETSVTNKFYHALKKEIIKLKYYPGQVLTVQELANEYNISRTPVKEALLQLRGEGFFEESAGNKFVISRISWKHISDLYETQILLESYAIRVSEGNVKDEQIQKLREHTEKMENALCERNYSVMFAEDQYFHDEILALGNNEVMQDIYRRINSRQQRIRFLTVGVENRLKDLKKEHEQIISFIEQGNAGEAVRSLSQHLRGTLEDINWLKNNNPLFGRTIE